MLDAEPDVPRIALSIKKAAKALDCSEDHIDDLVARGELEKIKTGLRRVAITWRSILKLLPKEVA